MVAAVLSTTAQNINIPDAVFKNTLLSYQILDANSNTVMLDSNNDGEIEVSEAALLSQININNNAITDLTGIRSFANVSSIWVQSTGITSINVDGMTNLSVINIRCTNLVSLSINGLPNLITLNSPNSNLSSIDFSQCPLLEDTRIENNNFTTVDFSNNPELFLVYLSDNPLNSVIFDNNLNLTIVQLNNTNLSELDLSNTSTNSPNRFSGFELANNPNLNYINIKNGLLTYLGFSDIIGSDLKICADDLDMSRLVAALNARNIDAVINSYCSFVPGGPFHEIQGAVSVDLDNNGCDAIDPVVPYLVFNVTDGTNSGSFLSDQAGDYYLPVSDGQHTITPQTENPSYWNFSPATVVVDFPTEASPSVHDFCVTANGAVEDLEVMIFEMSAPRPGFEVDYRVVVRNKGNQTTSGAVTVEYQNDFMTLLSSSPMVGTPAVDELSWNFTNLSPFHNLIFDYTMTLNTPTAAINPLDIGDFVNFTATVNGLGIDAMPGDNVMDLKQGIVNSYDPNDKTCLQGTTISPNKVGEYVHYKIRFENLGTASAVNVVIKDEINVSKFDVSTLIPLHSSHDYVMRVKENNVVEFIFENINLDFDDATNDGYVLFKIKTLTTLTEGDSFDNTAGIYFDFNAPIITNTEVVTVMSTAGIGEVTDESILVYPNPSNGTININSSNLLVKAALVDLNGRLIQDIKFIGINMSQQLNFSTLNKGIYFLTITTELGSRVEKLVIK